MFEQNYEDACSDADNALLGAYSQLCETILTDASSDNLKKMAHEFLAAIKKEKIKRETPALLMARVFH